jgi:hypothetical protein
VTSDVYTEAILFEPQGDMIRMRYGIYRVECGRRTVLVSPAIYSLLQTDKASVLQSLMVSTDDGMKWIMDCPGEL